MPRNLTPHHAKNAHSHALPRRMRAWPYFAIGIILVALDQLLKWIARTSWIDHPAAFRIVTFDFTGNTGASFSMLQGANAILIWVSIMALGALLFFKDALIENDPAHPENTTARAWRTLFYTLLLAGILGNLIDRLALGYVTDFIDLGWFPVFNIADSCLTIGVAGFIILEIVRMTRT